MSAALVTRASALPSVERARDLLAECRTSHDVKKIRVVAQAVATLERGKEIAIEAAEIVLRADARIGELTKAMPKAAPSAGPGRGKKTKSASTTSFSKASSLTAQGITKQQAATCEKIANLDDDGGLDTYVAACRLANEAPTAAGALALAKLPAATRTKAIAKMGEVGNVRKAIAAVSPKVAADSEGKGVTVRYLPFDVFHDTTARAWLTEALRQLLRATPPEHADEMASIMSSWATKFHKKKEAE